MLVGYIKMENFTFLQTSFSLSDMVDDADDINYLGVADSTWENITGSTEMDRSLLSGRNTPSNANLHDMSYRFHKYLSQPHNIISLVLGIVGIIFNVFSILALFQIRNRLNTHYRLIISLAVSDTLIGISILMHLINKIVHTSYKFGSGPWDERLKSRCFFLFIKALNTTSLNISLLNLMGMSIDHYMAITKPLKYHKLMDKKRARIMIITLWIIATICGFSGFFSGISIHKIYRERYNFNYCESVHKSLYYHEEYSMLVIAFLCTIVMFFIYVRIYVKVKRHRAPGEIGQVNINRKREEKRNKKALITTLLVLGSFVLCWLPTCLFQLVLMVGVRTRLVDLKSLDPNLFQLLIHADKYLLNLLLLNSICDPIIYTVRCQEVRLGYRRLFGRLLGKKRNNTRGRSSKRGSFKTSFMTLGHVDRHAVNDFATAETVLMSNRNGVTLAMTSLSTSSNSKLSE